MTDFKQLLGALVGARVEFIIIGGMAALVHGSVRLTEDIDIVYRRTLDNIQRLALALARHQPYLRGAPPGLPFRWDSQTIERGLNFTLHTALGEIDLFGEIPGGGKYEDLLPYCVDVEVFGKANHVIGLERLIHVKRAAGRRKDLDAIAELEVLRDQLGIRNQKPQ